MKTNTSRILRQVGLLLSFIFLVSFYSCEKDEPIPEDPIASFQYQISSTNYLVVTFTNYSLNAKKYNWDFGDGQTSTEESPTHTYAAVGNYEVKLVAINSAKVESEYSVTIEVKDPNAALALLAGETSKTWKLYRVGTSIGIGPNAAEANAWWQLENNGKRPCVYFHTFTFHRNGSYVFNDQGIFWGEDLIFDNKEVLETCFPAVAGNMINKDGINVSAFLSGSHTFAYEPTTNTVTLTGNGAWIGLAKLGTSAQRSVPQTTTTFNAVVEEHDGFDLLIVSFTHAAVGHYWQAVYAHYHNPALEPPVVEIEEPWGEDLPNITPEVLFHTFESETSFELIGAIGGGSSITLGVDDPLDAEATKVGRFTRNAGVQYQELQLRSTPDLNDIQFDNFTSVKIDIYVPANTDFSTLKRHFVFGFADLSQTQEWWNSPVQFLKEGEDVVLGAWTTYTFDLTDVKARTDLDMIYIGLGGGGHEAGGTFYVRNLIFE
jgi:PKD repeat protein